MAAPETTSTEFLASDTRFHVALAELSGNSVVAAMMSALRESIESYVTAAVSDLVDWERMAPLLRAQHAAIVNAVQIGDAEQASALVAAHITEFYSSTGIGQQELARTRKG